MLDCTAGAETHLVYDSFVNCTLDVKVSSPRHVVCHALGRGFPDGLRQDACIHLCDVLQLVVLQTRTREIIQGLIGNRQTG
jgi:hypothetical protein